MWTEVAALTIFIGMGVYGATLTRDLAFGLHHVVIRAVYLAMAAALLGYLGAHKRSVDSNMTKLDAWPRGSFEALSTLAQNQLAHTADLLYAPRVLMFWEKPDEPWIHLAVWSRNMFLMSREPQTRLIGSLPNHSLTQVFLVRTCACRSPKCGA